MGFFNVAANRETTILALPRTCVGDDACIVPATPRRRKTHRVGGRCRKACRGGACPARKPCGGANARGLVWPPCQRGAGCGESRRPGGLFRSRQPFPKGCAGGVLWRWAAASGGGISWRGNPSARAWRRGHLPLTREANCRAGLATNRETMIRALSRTRVGADSISARSAMPQTPAADMESAPTMVFSMLQPTGKPRSSRYREPV